MRCAHCDRPGDDTRVLSTHHTSEGWVRYRRCACGRVSVELLTLDEGLAVHSEELRVPAAA